ncbi:chemotaxis protein CheC [Chitinolyticbacter albus]|uniref:chemotaxis protein CheC n=1 Tax=Chitinolyticbacter albus TaxID=2961951 RepID=UPI00210C3632|nr:chemotaxis protein CheC [Chitinolyticbacter albus]
MIDHLLLTPDQRDALQEVTNIAMGQAGSQLAQILESFVQLSVPRINITESAAISTGIAQLVGTPQSITAVRQAFNGTLRGEAMVMYDQDGCRDLADLMGYEDDLDGAADRELLLDVSNVLVGACLNGIAELLQAKLSFSAPTIMAENVEVGRLINPQQLTWNYALLVEVHFTLEVRDFTCHLLTLMPEESILTLKSALDTFMENF